MENASNGCVKTVTKRSKICVKTKENQCTSASGTRYVNRPIFRRKLIEKYSTARYNINTKRASIKKSSLCHPSEKIQKNELQIVCKNDEKDISARDARLTKDSLGSTSSNHEPSLRAAETKDQSHCATFERVDCANSPETRKSKVTFESSVSPSIRGLDSTSVRPRCIDAFGKDRTSFSLEQGTSPGAKNRNATKSPNELWRIASKSVYQYLWEACRNTAEAKLDSKNESRKQKKKGRKRTYQKKNAEAANTDPYLDCFNESNNATELSLDESDKLGIIMYLGVNRPLFPLIYRNLRLYNGSNDTKITSLWSEFALSTLITKREDKTCKPILVPVKDPELSALLSECDEQIVDTKILDVSNETCTSEDDRIKEESQVTSENISESFSTGSRRGCEQYMSEHEFKTFELRNSLERSSLAGDVKVESSSNECAAELATKRQNASTFDEKAILKKFGYKECFVAIPKLSDTLIHYLSRGNYSNPSRQLCERMEKRHEGEQRFEKIDRRADDEENFGLILCARTDGILIDYVSRNRTAVYQYKLKKMLDFQKTNNRYFVSCDYVAMDGADDNGDSIVDVVSSTSTNVGHLFQSKGRSSKNPNDLFNSIKIGEFRDKSIKITWVKNHLLKNARNVRWLSIKLDKSIVALRHGYANMRYRLLFEVVYRADLTKKVICSDIRNSTDPNELLFGVYAFPGVCDRIFVGPYSLHEPHKLFASIRTNDGKVEPAQINVALPDGSFTKLEENYINAEWWSHSDDAESLNQRYLNSFFRSSSMTLEQCGEKLNLAKLVVDHPCLNHQSYQIYGREHNFVLFHDRTTISKSMVNSVEHPPQGTRNVADTVAQLPVAQLSDKQMRKLRKRKHCKFDDDFINTDYIKLPSRKKDFNFHIVDVQSLRNKTDKKVRTKKHRYRECPQQHIENERMRRLEFRKNRNNLAAVCYSRPNNTYFPQSLVSILNESVEIIKWLEIDNKKLEEESNKLRQLQNIMIRKYSTLTRKLGTRTQAYKNALAFMSDWKKNKVEQKKKLLNTFCNDRDELTLSINESASSAVQQTYKVKRFVELSAVASKSQGRGCTDELPASGTESRIQKPNQMDNRLKNLIVGHQTQSRRNKRKRKSVHRPRDEHVDEFNADEPLVCDFGEEVFREDGTSIRDPLEEDADREIPVVYAPSSAFCAVDPLAEDDNSAISIGVDKKPSYSLFSEHSYCSAKTDETSHQTVPRKRRKRFLSSVTQDDPSPRLIAPKPTPMALEPIIIEDTTPATLANKTNAPTNFRTIVRRTTAEHLSIDIVDNDQVFARLNIAKLNDFAATGSAKDNGVSEQSSNKIVSLMQRILRKMEETTSKFCSMETVDEKTRYLKRKLLVHKLKSVIQNYEMRKEVTKGAPSSSVNFAGESSNSNESPIVEDVRLPSSNDTNERDDGYSSKSEGSSDVNDAAPRNVQVTVDGAVEMETESRSHSPITIADDAIENILLDEFEGVGDMVEEEENEMEEEEMMMVEEEEEEEVEEEEEEEEYDDEALIEEEIIEEEEEGEEDEEEGGEEIVAEVRQEDEQVNDDSRLALECDEAVQRDIADENSPPVLKPIIYFDEESANTSDKRDDITYVTPSLTKSPVAAPKTAFALQRPSTSSFTSGYTIIRPREKTIPSIIRMSRRVVNDNLPRIQVKPASKSTNQAPVSSNDSFIKRLWYSPVSEGGPTVHRILRRENNLAEIEKFNDSSEQSENQEKSRVVETQNNSTEDNACKRICIKQFAQVGKFIENYESNVDKLLINE